MTGENFPIMFDDLREDVQKSLLKFLGMKNQAEGNFEIAPLALVPRPEPEEEE